MAGNAYWLFIILGINLKNWQNDKKRIGKNCEKNKS